LIRFARRLARRTRKRGVVLRRAASFAARCALRAFEVLHAARCYAASEEAVLRAARCTAWSVAAVFTPQRDLRGVLLRGVVLHRAASCAACFCAASEGALRLLLYAKRDARVASLRSSAARAFARR
jgi:hypothetical protein